MALSVATRGYSVGSASLVSTRGYVPAVAASVNRYPLVIANGRVRELPAGDTIKGPIGTHAWQFGAVNTVSPTAQNRTLTVIIDGVTYYITAKTTND